MTNEQPATPPPPAPPPPPDPPPSAQAPEPSPAPVLVRGWLRGLLRGIRHLGVPPRDPRVKALWVLLRRRQVLDQNVWIKATLRRIWQQGLGSRHRPSTTRLMLALLRGWGVLRPRPLPRYTGGGIRRPAVFRPLQRLRPVTLRRVGTARPLQAMRPRQLVRPLQAMRAVRPLQPRRGRR